MRDENRSAVSTSRSFSKEGVACSTRRSFNGHLLFLRERTDVHFADFKSNRRTNCRASAPLARPRGWQAERLAYKLVVVSVDQFLHKLRIAVARSSAQAMIQVTNDQLFIAEAD